MLNGERRIVFTLTLSLLVGGAEVVMEIAGKYVPSAVGMKASDVHPGR